MFEREKTRPEETSGTTAFLGKGTRIVGKLTFEGSVRIEGQIEGEINAQDALTIGEASNGRVSRLDQMAYPVLFRSREPENQLASSPGQFSGDGGR